MSAPKLAFLNPRIRIGCHVTKIKTLTDTVSYYRGTPLRAYQVFLGGPQCYNIPKLNIKDVMHAREMLEADERYFVVHGAYVFNLAGSAEYTDDPMFDTKLLRTTNGLISELDVCVGLDAGVVVHIGACKNKEAGIEQIAKTIEECLTTHTPELEIVARALGISEKKVRRKRRIILENAAGEKNKIGSTFDDLAKIYSHLDKSLHGQVSVCIDTQHIFGAGEYDLGLSEEVSRMFADFDAQIGLEKLELFHLNDSKVEFGAKKDRHESLCEGHIFKDHRIMGLKRLIEKADERPLIAEPPKDAGFLETYGRLKKHLHFEV